MSGNGIAQILVYLVVLVALSYPLGTWMAYVYSDRFRVPRWLGAPGRGFYLLMGTEPREELKAKQLEKVIYFAANLVTYVDEERRQNDLPSVEAEYLAELGWFGEAHAGACGNCDNCLEPPQSWDGTIAARKALSCVFRSGQRFGHGAKPI